MTVNANTQVWMKTNIPVDNGESPLEVLQILKSILLWNNFKIVLIAKILPLLQQYQNGVPLYLHVSLILNLFNLFK